MADQDIETMIDAYAVITWKEDTMKTREHVSRTDKVAITILLSDDTDPWTWEPSKITYQPTSVVVTFHRHWEDGKIKIYQEQEWRVSIDTYGRRILKTGELSNHLSGLVVRDGPSWRTEAIKTAHDRMNEIARAIPV